MSNRMEEKISGKEVNKMKRPNRYIKLIAPAAFALLLILTSSVFAQGPANNDGNKGRHRAKDQIMQELGLSEEQQTQLSANKQESQAKAKALMTAKRDAEKRLREELDKYESDTAKLQSIAAEIKDIESKIVDSRIATISDLKKILTEEQFQTLRAKIKERQETFKKNRGEHGKGGMRPGFGRPGMGGPECQKGPTDNQGPGPGPQGGPQEGPDEF